MKKTTLSPLESFYLERYLSHPRKYLFQFNFAFMILGIVISVGILGAGLNLFEGYERTLKTLLLDSMSHISIQRYNGEYLDENDIQNLQSVLAGFESVESIEPMFSATVMVSHDGIVRGCQLKAYDNDTKAVLSYEKYVTQGSTKPSPQGIIVGHYLARELGLSVGDDLSLVYPQFERISAMGMYPSSRTYRIDGLYQSGYYEYDRSLIIASKETADELTMSEGKYSYLELRLSPKHLARAATISRELERKIGKDLLAIPWTAYNQGLFRLIVIEKWLIFIIFSFLVLISGLNVVSAVTAVIYDKKNEIAILKTIGATSHLIKKLLYLRIALICLISILLGQILGVLLSLFVVKQNFYTLKGDVYFIDRLVMHVSPLNQAIIFACAALMIYICIRVPLKSITKMEVIDVLRHK